MRTEEEVRARLKNCEEALAILERSRGPLTIRLQYEAVIDELKLILNEEK